ncbi:MAG: fluoride efflux transporter CrcB [Hyphomicrobiaceae bacterium]|nr:fluoride efflux transporter CrcB [Hyphomicrobiaceae bacterium]
MRLFLLACAGGALGAGARYIVNVAVAKGLGAAVPWATFAVNVVGSLAMGLLTGYIVSRALADSGMRVFLATGVLGGFTTFSAFSLDVVGLAEHGHFDYAALYLAGSVVISIAACFAGLALARMIFA